MTKFHFRRIPLCSKAHDDVIDFDIINYDDVTDFVNFAQTKKSKYLENKILFFRQIKKFINYTLRATLLQKMVL